MLLLLALAAAAATGCRSISKRRLEDTEGRSFEARCDREGSCTLKQTAGPTVSDPDTELRLWSPGALVAVCNSAPASEPKSASDCRALVCQADENCPPAHGIKHGHCVNGLCREPAHSLTVDDAVMLCLAATGLGRETKEQAERYALAQNCGSPCKVPSPCRQP
jgi:hypothetical protein